MPPYLIMRVIRTETKLCLQTGILGLLKWGDSIQGIVRLGVHLYQ
jgi:hypothetical protein